MPDDFQIKPAHYPERQHEREAEIAQCLEDMRARDIKVRVRAIKRIGQLGAPCLPPLLQAAVDPIAYVRSTAVEALGYSRREAVTPEVIDCLLASIDDPNSHVVFAAIRSLGQLRAEAGREQIVACLDDPNPVVVDATIRALARLGPPLPVERIAEFLDSANAYLRASAAKVVGDMGYTLAAPSLLRNLQAAIKDGFGNCRDLPENTIEALGQLGAQEAIPLLLDIALHKVGLRSKAVTALMRLQAAEVMPVLSDLLADPSNELRVNLVRMMIQIGYKTALPAVRSMLRDPNSRVRSVALRAVTEWQDLASVERVRLLAHHDRDPFMRAQAVHSLAALARPQAIPELISFLGDVNTRVRLAAVLELGHTDGLSGEAVAALQNLAAQEQVAEVVEAAQAALARLGNVSVAPPASAAPPSLPVPDALCAKEDTLLADLMLWQETLPTLLGKCELEAIARIDTALTTLITALRLHAGG